MELISQQTYYSRRLGHNVQFVRIVTDHNRDTFGLAMVEWMDEDYRPCVWYVNPDDLMEAKDE